MFVIPTKSSSWKAVSQASGIAAAWHIVRLEGTGMRSSSGTETYSAYPPPQSKAMTRSSGFHCFFTPGPRVWIVPATSRPMMSLSPAGGGYRPRLCGKHKIIIFRPVLCKFRYNSEYSESQKTESRLIDLQEIIALYYALLAIIYSTCNRSALLRAAAWTLIRTSPALGLGLGTDCSSKFSGPPGRSTHTARIILATLT